ncbi:unnamed protein product [Polarella glacialis]|uniref:Arf-GAP domain-containing protein n=1 Tax=Polarella glacialis TaxID=89957 RepID=A0A813DSW5_POLGL|nr:unnamed protein product [Polarella glacialis]
MWPLGGSPMASPQTHSPWRGQVSHGSVWTAALPPAPPQVLRGATAVWQPLAPQASLARPLVAEQSTPAAPSSAGFQPMAMAAPAYANGASGSANSWLPAQPADLQSRVVGGRYVAAAAASPYGAYTAGAGGACCSAGSGGNRSYIPPPVAFVSGGGQQSFGPSPVAAAVIHARSYVPPPGSGMPPQLVGGPPGTPRAVAQYRSFVPPVLAPATPGPSGSPGSFVPPPEVRPAQGASGFTGQGTSGCSGGRSWSYVPPPMQSVNTPLVYEPPLQQEHRRLAARSWTALPSPQVLGSPTGQGGGFITSASFVAPPPPPPPPPPQRPGSFVPNPRSDGLGPSPRSDGSGGACFSGRSPSGGLAPREIAVDSMSATMPPRLPVPRRHEREERQEREEAAEPLSLDRHNALPSNEECADCGASSPDWASVNQGSLICIDCAGTHRSLGAHISKVKSTRLDTWKPEEVRLFVSQGGNDKVNRRLLEGRGLPRPPRGAPRERLERHIRAKYQPGNFTEPTLPVMGGSSSSRSSAPRGPRPELRPDGGSPEASPCANRFSPASGGASLRSRGGLSHVRSATSPGSSEHTPVMTGLQPHERLVSVASHRDAARVGTTCHQGLVIVDVLSVDIGVERAQDLRTLGPLFLSLSVALSLGSVTAERTSAKRGSERASWYPAERREMLWDAEEKWLWCRIFDGGDFTGFSQLAGEGRVNLLELVEQRLAESGSSGGPGLLGSAAELVEIELFAQSPEAAASDSEEEASADSSFSDSLALATGASSGAAKDPSDPSRLGGCIGTARLQLTIIDMTGMLSSQEKKRIAPADISPTWSARS